MKRIFRLLACPAITLCLWGCAHHDKTTSKPPEVSRQEPATQPMAEAMRSTGAAQTSKAEPADLPAIKGAPGPNNGFVKRHEGFLKDKEAMHDDVGFVLLGDSITDGWRTDPDVAAKKSKKAVPPGQERGGKKVYDSAFGQYKPLNLGIGGDRTQHVLWRIDNGELDGIHPKVLMLMIGTNNLGPADKPLNTNDEIVRGITKIVHEIRQKLPDTKILLLGIFPRGMDPKDPKVAVLRQRIKDINAQIASLDDGQHVKYLDIGDKFLQPDGTLPKDIMPDALHPDAKGYQIWADAVGPTLAEMMK